MKAFTNQEVIKGVGFFNDAIDGKEIDSGSVFIEEQMDERNGRVKGFRTVEYKTQGSAPIKQIIHLDFPINAEVTYESQVSKGGNKIVITAIRLVSLAKPNPAAVRVPA
jgi:hypothetical protein